MSDWQGPYGHRDENTDPKLPPLMVFFKEEAIKNEAASKLGPPVYETVTQIKVLAAGQKQSFPIYEIERVLADGTVKQDKAVYWRFREVYDAWKAKQQPAASGTPLEQWPLMDRATIAAFKDSNVFTVQQLASLPDGALGNIRAKGQEWRAKAKAWLEDAGNAALAVELRSELAKRDEQIEELKQQMAALLKNQNGITQGFEKRRRSSKRTVEDGDDIPIDLPPEAEAEPEEARI